MVTEDLEDPEWEISDDCQWQKSHQIFPQPKRSGLSSGEPRLLRLRTIGSSPCGVARGTVPSATFGNLGANYPCLF